MDVPIITGPSYFPKDIKEGSRVVGMIPGRIGREKVRVLLKEENEEMIQLTVERVKDNAKFLLTETKPGPWDQYPYAKPLGEDE